MDRKALFTLLESEVKKRNSSSEISWEKPDPLLIASVFKEEYCALVCALFAYGNVFAIVKFLKSLDFSLLEATEETIYTQLHNAYYRFQSSRDIQEFFITLQRLKKKESLESLFVYGYSKNHNVMEGLQNLIQGMYDINSYRSKGYEFLLGKVPTLSPSSPYKRWHMFLRWMVRQDNLDLGLWQNVHKKDLYVPLDTHTFSLGQKLGLIQRKTYDFKAVIELTEALKQFDGNDPVKYDFALYRLGQEKILP